jgi:hypothetical protein
MVSQRQMRMVGGFLRIWTMASALPAGLELGLLRGGRLVLVAGRCNLNPIVLVALDLASYGAAFPSFLQWGPSLRA